MAALSYLMAIKIKQDLKNADVRGLISDLIGININSVLEWGKQQDVSAMPSFVTVQLNPSARLGVYKKFNKQAEIQRNEGQRETTAIISFHGNNAVKMAEFTQECLYTEQAKYLFDRIKAGLVNVSDVQNLTIPFGGGYEERAQFQMILSHDFIIEHEQNRIESVDIGLVLNQ